MQKIAKNDTVIVRSGKGRGKKGKVLQVLPVENLVVVDGVNKVYRHVKPQRQSESGQRLEVNGPISIANVMLICPACDKATRVGFKIQGSGEAAKKIRMCRKCKKPVLAKLDKKKS